MPGSSVTLVPNVLNMVVGQTQTLQALNASGQSVTGLKWTSSNTQVVSLSTDDPPVLTAVAAGHVTIMAGNASADVTVYLGPTLPLGTVIWSNPGDGSGVTGILPAVPSQTGVADVFALNGDCNVQAITADGGVGWTANIGSPPLSSSNRTACNQFLPDFQGGMIVESETGDPEGRPAYHFVQRFDGLTGQAYPAYEIGSLWWSDMNFGYQVNMYPPSVVSTDGTVFVIDFNNVDVVNTKTGQLTAAATPSYPAQPFDSFTPIAYGNLIVAGDGYAYVPYEFSSPGFITPDNCFQPSRTYFGLLRVGTAGDSSTIPIGQWDGVPCAYGTGAGNAYVITNADQGVLVSWQLKTTYTNQEFVGTPAGPTNYLTVTSGTSIVSQTAINVPGQVALQPVVQRQDGSYVGAYGYPTRSYTPTGAVTFIPFGMLAFTSSGNALWSVPGDSPQIATADNGVIGASGVAYDADGNATGQLGGLPTYSWLGRGYQLGSVDQVASLFIKYATTFAALVGGNNSANKTSVQQQWFPPLPSCYDNFPKPAVSCPGPEEAVWSTFQKLSSFLQSPCPNCSTFVFQKLGRANDQTPFLRFLNNAPGYYDGTKSQMPIGFLCQWGTWDSEVCTLRYVFSKETVSQYLANNPGTSAISQTPGLLGPLTFFVPSAICQVNPSGFFMQSLLFHEGLHGFYGQLDATIEEALGTNPIYGSEGITFYIQQNAFRQKEGECIN